MKVKYPARIVRCMAEFDPKIARELKDAMTAAAKAADAMSGSFSATLVVAQQLREAMQSMSDALTSVDAKTLSEQISDVGKAATESSDDVKSAFDEMAESIDDAASTTSSLNAQLRETEKAADRVAKKSISGSAMTRSIHTVKKELSSLNGVWESILDVIGVDFVKHTFIVGSALGGLLVGLKNIQATGKFVASTFMTMTSWAAKLGIAILSIPVQVLTGLIDMAAQAELGGVELAQAFENVRKTFGRFTDGASKSVTGTYKSMQQMNETGLSAFRIFGTIAEQLDKVREVAEALGATWNLLGSEFAEGGGRLLWFQKGLGITNDQMKTYAQYATTFGRSMTDVFVEQTRYTEDLGAAFGVAAKVLSRDVAAAMQDVGNFAGATTQQITEAAVWTQKLGLELKEITGLLQKFKTFDAAAEAASQMAQSFGVAIDAFQMMQAQDPATQLDMLRKQFAAAGVDSKNFSRQQLELVTNMTGLDAATARAAFSLSNQGLSMDDVRKKGDDAAKKQLTQAEALEKLSTSIERMVRQLEKAESSYVKMFLKGFTTGIQRTREFWGLMRDIRQGLWMVYREGFRLGKQIFELVPELGEIMRQFRVIFEPKSFQQMARNFSNVIVEFFNSMTGKGTPMSFSTLMDTIRTRFLDFFDSKLPAGKKILENFKIMLKNISRIVGESITWVGEQLASGLNLLTDLITGKVSLAGVAGATGAGAGFVVQLFQPLIEGAIKALPALGSALTALGKALFDQIKKVLMTPVVAKTASMTGVSLVAMMLGPTVTRIAAASVVTHIASMMLGTGGGAGGTGGIVGMVARQFKGINPLAAAGGTAQVASAAKEAQDATDAVKSTGKLAQAADMASSGIKGTPASYRDMFTKIVAIGAGLAVAGPILAAGAIATYNVLSTSNLIEPTNALKFAASFSAVAIASGELLLLAGAAKLIAKVKVSPAELGVAAATVTGVGLVVAAFAVIANNVVGQLEPTRMVALGKMMLAVTTAVGLMVPVTIGMMALGGIVTASTGAALIPLAVGMTTVGVVITQVVTVMSDLIDIANRAKLDESKLKVLDVYVKVIGTTATMMSSLAAASAKMSPSLTDLIFSSREMRKETMTRSVEIVSTIGDTVSKMVNVVKSSMSTLMYSDELQKSSSIFFTALNAVTQLLQATTPPPEFYTAKEQHTKAWLGIGGVDVMSKVTFNLTEYFSKTQANTSAMLSLAKQSMAELMKVELTDAQIKSLPVLSNVLTTVVSLLKAVTPDTQTIANLRLTRKESANVIGMSTELQELDIPAFRAYTAAIQRTFTLVMSTFLSESFTNLIEKMGSLDKTKLEKLSLISTILSSVSSVISSVTDPLREAVKIDNIDMSGDSQKYIENINIQIPSVARTLSAIFENQGVFDQMIQRVIQIAQLDIAKQVGGGLKEKLEQVKNVFDAMKHIGGFLNVINEVSSTMKATEIKGGTLVMAYEMAHRLHDINTIIEKVFLLGSPSKKLFENIRELTTQHDLIGTAASGAVLSKMFEPITQAVNDIVGSLTALGTTGIAASGLNATLPSSFKAINDVMGTTVGHIGTTMSLMNQMATTISDNSAAFSVESVNAVDAVASQVNTIYNSIGALDDLLNKPVSVDVKAWLSKFAKNVGLNATKYRYSVNARPEVKINLNLEVTMAAEEVERAILFRKRSVIRDQLEWIRTDETSAADKTYTIPNTPRGEYLGKKPEYIG